MSSNLPRTPLATTIGLGLIAALLLVGLLVSDWNIRRLIDNEGRVIHAQKVLTTLQEVLATVTEAETAERGYLITDDPEYLVSYESAVERTPPTLRHLTNLLAHDQEQRRGIEGLKQRIEARFGELRNAIAARNAGGFDAAKQSVSLNHGRQLMNEMRRLVEEMQDSEREALQARADQSARSASLTRATNLIGAALGICMVAMAFYLVRRDLANRQRAEDAARRLAAIVESSDDAIVSKTLDGIIVSWNAGARRLYGYTADEVIGKPITILCPSDLVTETSEHLEQLRQGLRQDHFETRRLCKDGQQIDISLSLSPIRDAGGQVIGASAISRDITERKTLQREVLEIAAREQRRIGQDLHDGTGQELTGLAMMAERLAGLLANRSLPEAEAAAKIVDGLEQALDHVRALSKGLVPVEVDAEGLMMALSELTRRNSRLHGIHCTFECDKPVCILDNETATHLYRMSQEAITNAIKHAHADHVVISLSAQRDVVTLKIVDDGVGFDGPVEELAGTGLQIMRYRAELIGAKWSIGLAEPHGTQVVCTLTHKQSAWQPATA